MSHQLFHPVGMHVRSTGCTPLVAAGASPRRLNDVGKGKKNKEGWAVIASRGCRGREVVLILSSLSFSLTGSLPGCSLSPSQISQPGNPGIGSAAVLMRRLMSFVGESFHSKSGYRGFFLYHYLFLCSSHPSARACDELCWRIPRWMSGRER